MNLIDTIAKRIREDQDQQLFIATVVNTTVLTAQIQRPGRAPDAQYWPVAGDLALSITDEVVVARMGSGYTVIAKLARSLPHNVPSVYYDVTAYGATGDGATDDTTAVQAAIADAVAAGGGVVWFPAGTYLCTKLTIYTKVVLRGAGPESSIIQLKSASNSALLTSDGFVTTDTSAGPYAFGIEDLTFDGNKGVQASNADSGCVQLYGYNWYANRVKVRNGKTVGLYTNWGTSAGDPGPNGVSMQSSMRDVEVEGNDGDGIYWNGPHDSIWDGVTVHSNAAVGANIQARGEALLATNCHSYGTTQSYAWYLAGYGASLVNCVGEGASTYQVHIRVNDCAILGGVYYAAGGSTSGIEIANNAAGATISTTLENFTTASVVLTTSAANSIFDLNIYATAGVALSGTLSTTARFRAVVNGGQTGAVVNGPRYLPTLWTQENVAASQTDVALYLLGGESGASTARQKVPMLYAGSITGVIVRSSGARAAGTLTIKVTKNGVATALTAVLDGTNTTFKGSYSSPGAIGYAIGDEIGATITTDGSWSPTTADISVMVEVTD